VTARTVAGNVEFPGGAGHPVVGARVTASLYTSASGAAVHGEANDVQIGSVSTLTNSNGAWLLDLEPNINITPAGTVYRIATTTPGTATPTVFYIEVPDVAVTHAVTDLIVTDQDDPTPAAPSGYAVTPEQFGDVDGDATEALQAAIDYGAPVMLRARTYAHTGLTINTNSVRLVGAGARRTVLQYSGSGVGVLVGGEASATRYVTIEGMELAGSSSADAGLRVQTAISCRFVDLFVTGNTAGYGIEILEGDTNFYLIFDGVVCTSNLYGATSIGQTIKWRGCRFQGNTSHGMIDFGTAPLFEGCGFEGNGGWGVQTSQNYGKVFTGCYWERNASGHLQCIETHGLLVHGGYAAAGATPAPLAFEIGRTSGSVPEGVMIAGVAFEGPYTSGKAVRLLGGVPTSVVDASCWLDTGLVVAES
jgi:hypothetical protein